MSYKHVSHCEGLPILPIMRWKGSRCILDAICIDESMSVRERDMMDHREDDELTECPELPFLQKHNALLRRQVAARW